MPDDPAKGFGTSASLDAAAAEGAKPCATAASNKHTSRSNRALLMITHTLTSAIMIHQPPLLIGLRIRATSRNLLTSAAAYNPSSVLPSGAVRQKKASLTRSGGCQC